MTRGKLITLEGVDGAGKSSHTTSLARHLGEHKGVHVVTTREPGGTALGEKIRQLLLHQDMTADTELLLMFAARSEHIARVIEPALARGDWVLCDRFTDASYAYQGGGRGIDDARIGTLARWTHPRLQPDRTLIFDVSLDVAQQRLRTSGTTADRFEQEQRGFFERVRAAYARLAAAEPQRIKIIDSSKSLEEVTAQVQFAVADL